MYTLGVCVFYLQTFKHKNEFAVNTKKCQKSIKKGLKKGILRRFYKKYLMYTLGVCVWAL